MSTEMPVSLPPAFPSLASEPDPAPLGWLLGMLQEAMAGVMAGESTPLQKANAVARLGGLYLKAYRVAELERTNKELAERGAELEQRLAALEAQNAERESGAAVTAETRKETGVTAPGRVAAPESSSHRPLPTGSAHSRSSQSSERRDRPSARQRSQIALTAAAGRSRASP